ncbi:MAG: hypothetical protein QG597_3218, partial [Actinomycetota bacterium]|nr:hypothetical protein [Actinomycetota bacterium]
ALHLLTDLLPDQVRTLGADHPDTLTTRHNIAYLTRVAGDRGEALRLYTELLPDQMRVLGADHPATRRTMNRIAYQAVSMSDLAPVITLAEGTMNEGAVNSLVLAAWRLGAAGHAPESQPTKGSLAQLLYRVADAASGDEQARSELPTEMLGVLESL